MTKKQKVNNRAVRGGSWVDYYFAAFRTGCLFETHNGGGPHANGEKRFPVRVARVLLSPMASLPCHLAARRVG